MMSSTFTTILVIIAVFASLSSLALTVLNASKETARLKRISRYPPKALVVEDKSGHVVVLDLEKQNDTQQILRTLDVLLGK
jgi:esterase/lipase